MLGMKEPGYRDEHAALLAKQAALEDEIAQLKADNRALQQPPSPSQREQARTKAGTVRPVHVIVACLFVVLFLAFTSLLLGKSGRTKRIDPGPAHSVQASWEAKVTNATGASRVAAGDACTISARIDYRGTTFHGVHRTVVTCGGVEIYSERGVFAAGNSLEVTYDATKKGGTYDFMLDERGVTTRPHPHASIDTAQGVGLIAGEAPRMNVDLAVVPGSKSARDDAPPP